MAETSLFVVGCGRSGTTLLRAMLNAHPRIAVPPESYFVVPLLADDELYRVRGELQIEPLITDLASYPSFSEWQLSPDVVRERWSRERPDSVADALADLYRAYAERDEKDRWADKTPFHALQIPKLAANFPDARFLHLIRDPRDTAASIVDAPFGPSTIGEAALYWRNYVSVARTEGLKLQPDRYLEVRYEELVEDPLAVLATITDAIGVEMDPAMLDYPESADRLLGPLRFRQHLQNIREPVRGRTRDWRDAPPADVALIEELVGHWLDDLGYPPSGVAVTSAIRARAAASRIRQGARRPVRRIRFKISRFRRRGARRRRAEASTPQ